MVNEFDHKLLRPVTGRSICALFQSHPDGLSVILRVNGNLTEELETEFFSIFSDSAQSSHIHASSQATLALFDFSGLQRINSIGVRSLLSLIRQIPTHVPVEYHHCVSEFVEQLNLLPFFLERGEIKSVCIEEHCPNSHASARRTLVIGADLVPSQDVMSQVTSISKQYCLQCGCELEQSEVASIFYAFLARIKLK